jgi:hypothetical protein
VPGGDFVYFNHSIHLKKGIGYVRPRSEVFTTDYRPPVPQSLLGPQLVKEYASARSAPGADNT